MSTLVSRKKDHVEVVFFVVKSVGHVTDVDRLSRFFSIDLVSRQVRPDKDGLSVLSLGEIVISKE